VHTGKTLEGAGAKLYCDVSIQSYPARGLRNLFSAGSLATLSFQTAMIENNNQTTGRTNTRIRLE
jgi:hypothetical protein